MDVIASRLDIRPKRIEDFVMHHKKRRTQNAPCTSPIGRMKKARCSVNQELTVNLRLVVIRVRINFLENMRFPLVK